MKICGISENWFRQVSDSFGVKISGIFRKNRLNYCFYSGLMPDCDSGCRGFEPRQSPQVFLSDQPLPKAKNSSPLAAEYSAEYFWRKRSRAVAKLAIALTWLYILLAAPSLFAQDLARHWKFSKPIKLSESVTVSYLTLYADPAKIGQPYFPVYGGVTEKVGTVQAWNDPIDGACRLTKGTNYVCEIRNSAVELRLVRIGTGDFTVYATEHSRMGAQGPYVMVSE